MGNSPVVLKSFKISMKEFKKL